MPLRALSADFRYAAFAISLSFIDYSAIAFAAATPFSAPPPLQLHTPPPAPLPARHARLIAFHFHATLSTLITLSLLFHAAYSRHYRPTLTRYCRQRHAALLTLIMPCHFCALSMPFFFR